MSRGASEDRIATKLLYGNGLFLDERSFVSKPRKSDGTIHLYLFGEDKKRQRVRIFERDKGRCFNCGSYVDWLTGEWDHIENKPWNRCDCMHNSRWACPQCHAERHYGDD